VPGRVEALSDLIEDRGELLRLVVEGSDDDLHAFNDCACPMLDVERTGIERFDDGRVMGIDDYVFVVARVVDETIFRLREMPESETLVTGRFVRRVEDAGLRGLRLDRPVWVPSDAPPL
jgi:hypothetical protein